MNNKFKNESKILCISWKYCNRKQNKTQKKKRISNKKWKC